MCDRVSNLAQENKCAFHVLMFLLYLRSDKLDSVQVIKSQNHGRGFSSGSGNLHQSAAQ